MNSWTRGTIERESSDSQSNNCNNCNGNHVYGDDQNKCDNNGNNDNINDELKIDVKQMKQRTSLWRKK